MGTLWNTYAFFVLYANIDEFDAQNIHWTMTSFRYGQMAPFQAEYHVKDVRAICALQDPRQQEHCRIL